MASRMASYDVIVPLSYVPLFSINSEPFTFMTKNYVCNNGPYGDLLLICKALWTLLRGCLMHTFDPLCFQVIYRV
jgi:hypothetical protein